MAFTFKLEHPDGTPADPPRSSQPSRTGTSATRSHEGPDKPALEVVGLRSAGDPEHQALLVVATS